MSLQIPHREKSNGAGGATKAVILVSGWRGIGGQFDCCHTDSEPVFDLEDELLTQWLGRRRIARYSLSPTLARRS